MNSFDSSTPKSGRGSDAFIVGNESLISGSDIFSIQNNVGK